MRQRSEVAQVAAISNPGLEAALTVIEKNAGPIVAKLQPMIGDVNADIPTIEALVQQLQAQVAAMLSKAAPAVKIMAIKG